MHVRLYVKQIRGYIWWVLEYSGYIIYVMWLTIALIWAIDHSNCIVKLKYIYIYYFFQIIIRYNDK